MTPDLILGIISLIVVNVLSPIIGYQLAARKAKDDFHDKALQNRYNLLYTPLRNLLLDVHITSSATLWPLSYRWELSLSEMKNFRLRQALQTFLLSVIELDHRVENNQSFPLKKISELVKKQSKWADATLLDTLQAAHRSVQDKNTQLAKNQLTSEEYQLANYILGQYQSLNRRLLPR